MLRHFAFLAWSVFLVACSTTTPSSDEDLSSTASGSVCSKDGWCWQSPQHTANALYGIAASGSKRVLVGDGLSLLEMSGSTVRGTTGVGWDAVRDVWADENGVAWAVARHGDVWRRDANKNWKRTQSPITEDLVAIWGTRSDQIWILGAFGAVARWDGKAWSLVPGTVLFEAKALWASGPEDVWISGTNAVRRWDGHAWHAIGPAGVEGSATFRVWGSGKEVWLASTTNPGILKVDRAKDLAFGVEGLKLFYGAFDVGGTGPNDVWIAGQNELHHFDGITWQKHAREWGENPVFLPDGMYLFPFHRIRALSPSEVWLLGDDGALARFDGARWQRIGPTPYRTSLGGILLARGSRDLWAIGDGETRHFDGRTWTNPPLDLGKGSLGIRSAILVGKTIVRVDRPQKDRLRVWALEDDTWRAVGDPIEVPWDCSDMWGSAMDDIWIASEQTVFHWDGKKWSAVAIADTCWDPDSGMVCWRLKLKVIHGSSRNDVWIVGSRQNNDVLIRFDGKKWTALEIPVHKHVSAVFTTGNGHGFLGGEGELYVVDHDTLRLVDLPGHQEIGQFVGTADDLWAAGGSHWSLTVFGPNGQQEFVERRYGWISHFDGKEWREEETGAGMPVEGIARTPDGAIWGLTADGLVRKR